MPEAHDFTIADTAGRKLVVSGFATEEPINVTQGYGGHPVAARPKRRGLSVYEGRQPFQMTVPMVLYRGHGGSVEKDRRDLDSLATARALAQNEQPPGVTISCVFPMPIPPSILAGGTMTEPACEWWVEELAWGDELRLPPSHPSHPGHLTRKLVTVTLLEKVDDEELAQHTGRWARHYHVKAKPGHPKKPETLIEIAARELGSANRVADIKAHNPHVRSNGSLKIGMVITLEGTDPPRKKPTHGGSPKHRVHR